MELLRRLHELVYSKVHTPVTAGLLPRVLRRYVAINLYDGALLALGVLTTSTLLGLPPWETVLSGLVIGTSSAISGFMGAFLVESAELRMELRELEKHLFITLGRRQVYVAGLIVSAVNALSTPAPVLLSLMPYLLAHIGVIAPPLALVAALAMTFTSLVFLGVWLAKIAGGGRLRYTLTVLASGLAILLLDIILGRH
ncbi:VIT1/CCC1 transporter family protein [Infirmifilum sp. SLHALR2]